MSEDVFHAAAAEIAVPAVTAFEYVSDGLRQGDWTIGSRNREALGGGLFRGISEFDGRHTYIRIEADRDRLVVDYHVGRDPEALLRLNTVRVVPGPLLGRPEGTCLLSLGKWRAPGEPDDTWRRAKVTFDTEIHIIKGRLELGF